MIRSLYSGISGLRNFQTKMDVIGNNIANVNTVAFKGSRITFAEAMTQTLFSASAPTATSGGTNPTQLGLGVVTVGINTNFNQGALESTGVLTDLAIQGNGFFKITSGSQEYYTRAGTFSIDNEGNLVMIGTGYYVNGYTAHNGELDKTSVDGIQIPLGRQSQAHATTNVDLYGNLDMNMTESHASLIDAGDTGINNVSGTARDGVGGLHSIEITGNNATQSSGVSQVNGLSLNDTLEDAGVSDITGFQITVDGNRAIDITGLEITSTIADLLRAINTQVSGVVAELDENGAVSITREYHGDGNSYNVQFSDGDQGSDLVDTLFGGQDGVFDVNNGEAASMVATDSFTPSGNEEAIVSILEIDINEHTGLATGLLGFGDGGVTIVAPGGLEAGTVEISTEDTKHSTSMFIYDALGNTHNLTINFIRTEESGVWRWTADVPEPALVIQGASGLISFSNDGSLENFTYDNDASSIFLTPGNDAPNIELTLNPGSFGDFDGITQNASSTSVQAIKQNGYGVGNLQDIRIDINGNILGNYSNGITNLLAQVILTDFINPEGLERVGENLYRDTINSGDPRVTEADRLGSKINSGYLEMSNVDLAREFTEMIVTQRAFQANARVITISDQLLQEVTSLKR